MHSRTSFPPAPLRQFVAIFMGVAILALPAAAQRGPGPQGARGARTSAPMDLTGTWVSVVNEDWRHRMITSRPGDYESVAAVMNAEARRVADSWDLTKDNAAGLECKAFGVGGIMRQPGRIRISWQDDNTLKLEFDAGTQIRLLNFNKSVQPSSEKTWQGHSFAEWEGGGGRGGQAARPEAPGGGGRGLRGGPAPSFIVGQGGALKVTTTNFREGYLRKNGVPYSESATITEYFHRLPQHPNGDNWLHVVTIVEDPKYLTQPFYTSTQFKLEPNASRFSPTPCRTPPPPPK